MQQLLTAYSVHDMYSVLEGTQDHKHSLDKQTFFTLLVPPKKVLLMTSMTSLSWIEKVKSVPLCDRTCSEYAVIIGDRYNPWV